MSYSENHYFAKMLSKENLERLTAPGSKTVRLVNPMHRSEIKTNLFSVNSNKRVIVLPAIVYLKY